MDPKNGSTTEEAEKQSVATTNGEKSEKDKLINDEPHHKIGPKVADQMRIAALVVSYISIFVTFVTGVTTLVIAILFNSSASYAFSANAFLDCITSSVILWRFNSKEEDIFSSKREHKACYILGIIFMVSFLSTFTKSLYDLIVQDKASPDPLIWHIYIGDAVICFVLAIVKFYLAYELESAAMATDGINSVLGFVVGVAIVISSIIYDNNQNIWYLDSIVGLLCSIIILIYGIKLVVDASRNLKKLNEGSNDIQMVSGSNSTTNPDEK